MNGGTGPVLLVSDDDTPPYPRPPLSQEFLRGKSEEADLPLEPDDFYTRHDVDVRLGTMVTGLHAEDRRAVTSDAEEIAFGRCVLATGNAPAQLPVPGADDRRDVAVAGGRPAPVRGGGRCPVGGGDRFRIHRMRCRGRWPVAACRWPSAAPRRCPGGAGRRIAGWLRDEGVVLRGGVTVTGIEDGRIVHLDGAGPVQADLVLVAAGATPRGTLAVATGLPIQAGRVVVDEHMRTAFPAVLAAGDVAFARNDAAGRHLGRCGGDGRRGRRHGGGRRRELGRPAGLLDGARRPGARVRGLG